MLAASSWLYNTNKLRLSHYPYAPSLFLDGPFYSSNTEWQTISIEYKENVEQWTAGKYDIVFFLIKIKRNGSFMLTFLLFP